jgi:hypothetical protein
MQTTVVAVLPLKTKNIFSRRTHSRAHSSLLKERKKKKERAYAPVHSSRLKPEKPKKEMVVTT